MKEKNGMRENIGDLYINPISRNIRNCLCGPGPSCYDRFETPADLKGLSPDLNKIASDLDRISLNSAYPAVISDLKSGETVIYLGSGGGFDCFRAATKVGETGRVIGIDMSSEMIGKARDTAKIYGFKNVEFRLGEIESLPVAGGEADIIISNCMINLSTDKKRVLAETYRVLKNGGRLALSEIVAFADIPRELWEDIELQSQDFAEILNPREIAILLNSAGFADINIQPKENSRDIIANWQPDNPDIGKYFWASIVQARKE